MQLLLILFICLFILIYYLFIYSIDFHFFLQFSYFLFHIFIILIQLPAILKTKELNNIKISLSKASFFFPNLL